MIYACLLPIKSPEDPRNLKINIFKSSKKAIDRVHEHSKSSHFIIFVINNHERGRLIWGRLLLELEYAVKKIKEEFFDFSVS